MKIPKKIKELPWPAKFKAKRFNFKVYLEWPLLGEERFLVATFVRNESNYYYSGERSFRLVCSKKQNRAAVLYPNSRAGVRRSLSVCLRDLRWYADDGNADFSKADKEKLAKWLEVDCDTTKNRLLVALDAWVEQANEDEVRSQMAARGELMDEDVDLCPDELPGGLLQHIKTKILPQDNTLIYKKGNVQGLCYICGKNVRADRERFRQGVSVQCPNCGSLVHCFLDTSNCFRVDYVEDIVAIQKGTDGKTVFLRQWHLRRDPSAEWEAPEKYLEEICRYAIRGNRVAKWQMEGKENWFGNVSRYALSRWTRVKSVSVVYDNQYYFHLPDDWKEIFVGTSLQYCNVDEYVTQKKNGYTRCNTIRFLMDWVRYPAIEKFWKAGYKELVSSRVWGLTKECKHTVSWSQSSIKLAIHFPFRFLKLHSPEKWTMSDMMRVTDLWKKVNDGLIKERDLPALAKSMIDIEDIQAAIGHASIPKILNYVGQRVDMERERRAEEKKAAEQKGKAYWGNGPLETPKTYRDYLSECVKLGLDLDDMEVLFPKDLKAAHARTIAQVKHKANEISRESFLREVQRLAWMEYEKDGLLIRLPVDGDELTAEGAYLHHCVGGYVDRMANGKTTIFLIRRVCEPDRPFYTLEWLGGRVQQCRTTHNRDYIEDEEVRNFVNAWVEKVTKKSKKKKQRRQSSAA